MEWLKSVHFYRKVPRDLTEATLAGGTISLISSMVMAYLFISNFSAYLSVDQKTSIVLDASQEKKLQLNFNVTLYHLPCRFATLDIVDVMGTHFQNVSTNIIKTRIETDAEGRGVSTLGRHAQKKEPLYAVQKTPAHVDVPKVSPDLDKQGFLAAVKQKRLVLVNFYAPWCPWSRRLQPVWEEAYMNVMKAPYANDVLFAKADCTSSGGQELCHTQHVHAFPSVKVYRRHNPHSHESYVGDRTHEALELFVDKNVHDSDHTEAVAEGDVELGAGRHEGCVMRGVVLVNRVPGNFHISAHSKSHSFQHGMLNMSHAVDSMSFGKMLSPAQQRLLPAEVAQGWNVLSKTDHIASGKNTTMEHYLKVVHTTYLIGSGRGKNLETYQYTVNNNNYEDGESLPAAVFSYDVSPMQVLVQEERESFAAFLTQLCAIIGGVFTVTGLLDGLVYHGHDLLARKGEIGKAI
jgi:thiol-disulfide isomerase/thioredoxin